MAAETVEAAPPPGAKPGSLRRLALRGSAFEMLGYGAGQVLRLASNLILSRLLFPEAFGLAALIALFNQGLVMLSDVGIEQSVVQNERGDDPLFLNTAWTLHVIRGGVLWLLACALAWPAAVVYREPDLLLLLPIGALNVLVQGFGSTSLFTLRRRLTLGVLTGIELVSQIVGLAVVVPLAFAWRSVWAIVVSGLAASLCRTVLSHLVDVGYKNRFAYDRSAKAALYEFGKYIFGSSALFFVSRQGDRMLLGRLIGMEVLGIYTIAVFLSEALGAVVAKVTHGVFYPIFSHVNREEPQRLREVYYKTRLRLDALSLPALGALTACGHWVVAILYDDRYEAAGWMLQALAVRVAMSCVLTPCETCLFSQGHTRWGFYQNIARSVWILIGIPLCFHYWGLAGVVWVTALSEIPVLLTLWPAFHRLGLLDGKREALAVAFFFGGFGVGLLIDQLFARFVGSI